MKFQSEWKHFHSRRCTSKCRLRNGGHFVSASMCQCYCHIFHSPMRLHIIFIQNHLINILWTLSLKWLLPLGFCFTERSQWSHYSDVIMGAMASKITSVSIVYSTVCSGADQRKHQSSASLAFVRGIHRWPVNSPHKGPVKRKMFPLDDVIMHNCHAIRLHVWFNGEWVQF